jgi:hypothetical protein
MIYLYHFTQYSLPNAQGSLVANWSYTSYEEPVFGVSGYSGVTFAPTAGISHSEVRYDREQASGTLKVTVARDNPVAGLFLAGYPAGTIYMRVVELDEPGGLASVIWRGRIRACEFEELAANLTCTSGNEKLARLGLSIVHGTTCQWDLYGAITASGGCGVDRATYQRTGVITAVSADGLTLTTSLSEANGFFKAGLVEVNGQTRMCTASTGGTLSLLSAISGAAAGNAVKAWKGCDRTGISCKTFSNYARFSGDEMPDPKNIFSDGAA